MTSNIRTGGIPRRLDGRNGEIAHRYYMLSQSQQEIADDLQISQSRVSQILTDIRADIDATTREDIRAGIAQRMASMRNAMAELVEMDGMPVTAGKDGAVVKDPENDVVVRDYSLRVKAAQEIRAIEERLAKLYGADEPTRTRTDVTIHGEQDGQDALAREAAADLDEGED